MKSEACVNHERQAGSAKTAWNMSARSSMTGVMAYLAGLWLSMIVGCTSSDVRPVDIFPEDMCAYCKMAVSDHRCASEIIAQSGEVFKFDDLSCLEVYRSSRGDITVAAVFVKDYGTKSWLPWEQAVIIRTGVFTPMGSGKVAFSDSTSAREFLNQHPVGGK